MAEFKLSYTANEINERLGRVLPSVTTANNDKILQVVNGNWELADTSSSGGQVSWNDVEDKPFGEEMVMDAVLEETFYEGFAMNADYGVYTYDISYSPFRLVVGEAYTVVWDGEIFPCIAQDLSAAIPGCIGLGNLSDFGGTGNNEKFAIGWTEYGITIFACDDSETHTVAIYQENMVVKPLDSKYIPFDAIDARIDEYIASALEGDY